MSLIKNPMAVLAVLVTSEILLVAGLMIGSGCFFYAQFPDALPLIATISLISTPVVLSGIHPIFTGIAELVDAIWLDD